VSEPFGARVAAATAARGQFCVGIDPHAGLLAAWGLPDDASGLESFAMTCVEALAPTIAVLKPQSAFFERHGSAGIAVLERAVAAARELGALVLLDAKRGDIGSTVQAYADAYLDPSSPLAVDAMTLSPYLGFESLRPALDVAAASGAGVFVLARTSNADAAQVQHAVTGEGATVAAEVLAAIAAENAGVDPIGSVGAVVGANLAGADEDFAVNGPLLAPGYGAQGGGPDDIRRIFRGAERLVLPSSSRDVLRHGPDADRLRAVAERTRDEVAKALS
jgi:orotidine-5'-phosphate decarboxylase